MRTLLCLLGAVAALAAPAAAHGDPPGLDVPVRVMSYNIHAGAGVDGRLDLSRLAAEIRAADPDVVGLQEVDVHWSARSQWADQATELADALGMRVSFAPIYSLDPLEPGAPRREYGLAVLSRHPVLAAENHAITRLSTQDPNPVPAPAPGFPEVLVNVRGALLRVYDTHLDFRPDPAVRRMQVADMLAVMGEDPGQKVLLGDLNATPGAPELAPLFAALPDAWATGGSGAGLTFPALAPDRRIDYVLASPGIDVRGAWTIASGASDHQPVVADLTLRRGR